MLGVTKTIIAKALVGFFALQQKKSMIYRNITIIFKNFWKSFAEFFETM